MSDFKMEFELIAQIEKQMEQRHRIRPAGNGNKNRITGGQERTRFSELFDLAQKLHERNLLGSEDQCNRQ